MALRCGYCDQTILATDTVCWHCGHELKPTQILSDEGEEMLNTTMEKENEAISITAVSIFAFITFITVILFIIITNLLAI